MSGLVMHPRRKVLVKASPYLYSRETIDGRAMLLCQGMSTPASRAIVEAQCGEVVEFPCHLGQVVEPETLIPRPLRKWRGLFSTIELVTEDGRYFVDVFNSRGELSESHPRDDLYQAMRFAEELLKAAA